MENRELPACSDGTNHDSSANIARLSDHILTTLETQATRIANAHWIGGKAKAAEVLREVMAAPATPAPPPSNWTVSSTAYLRNLDEEDLAGDCIAIHHAASPNSLVFPALIVSNYLGKPREVADRVAAILNAHWDTFGQPPADPWRLIDENTPREGWDSPIMTCRMGGPDERLGGRLLLGYAEPPEAAYWNDAGDCWTSIQRPHDPWDPTHWMPLPLPPAQKGEG